MAKTTNPVGRPSKVTKDVLRKLEKAFAIGCTDKEACVYADISEAVLYAYQKNHPEFKERKDQLKETPILRARTKIVESIEDDVKVAQWYAERKKPDEFAQQKQISIDHTHKLDDKQLLETFSQLYQLVQPNQSDVIEAEVIVPELEHNPDNNED